MVRGQGARGRFEKCIQKFSGEKLTNGKSPKDLAVDGTAILKLI